MIFFYFFLITVIFGNEPLNLTYCDDNASHHFASPRIINTNPTGPKNAVRWPHLVRIRFHSHDSPDSFGCGGTIISDGLILTAAHCCETDKDMVIYVNDNNINDETDPGEFKFKILVKDKSKSVTIHENYNCHKPPGTHSSCHSLPENDLCLIKLPRRLGYDEVNEKFCLSGSSNCVSDTSAQRFPCLSDEPVPPASSCWVAGWGAVKDNARSQSTVLVDAAVTSFSNNHCKNNLRNSRHAPQIKADHLCAGNIATCPTKHGGEKMVNCAGNDACTGDSGGPLICNVDGTAILAGVVSAGFEGPAGQIRCGRAGYPGIYSRLSANYKWISEQLIADHSATTTNTTTVTTTIVTTTTLTTTTTTVNTGPAVNPFTSINTGSVVNTSSSHTVDIFACMLIFLSNFF